ncbi:MAG: hypothetical protein COV91_02305 [Candidatus Taylorbacteria bacterium CG11_big_fil_rev_8_21_14_0_20_46_11]|uniref:DUF4446 domain-containing protein n=1 Tax=Candidatus Taylorbacteria bacterium CG11_big_fil_rev_8_21_14_0_20_46_11 TaxID=1975025 RepID=A0A2H0KC05_9BACT|nr:MAG: hypothetical protein COV91_02305 [Candidatus Taylorbacteria bacterium CG11_big_fil_rev_8_21_14_0_20_46_11]
MAIDTTVALSILCAIILITLSLVIHLTIRLNRLVRGKNAKSLEKVILQNASAIEDSKQFRKEMEVYLTSVESRLKQSIRGLSTIRFNPFKGTGDGGNQSFATAFLDEEKHGIVISTINTRERMSIFAKPITNGKSEYELTEEEQRAIKQAKERMHV